MTMTTTKMMKKKATRILMIMNCKMTTMMMMTRTKMRMMMRMIKMIQNVVCFFIHA